MDERKEAPTTSPRRAAVRPVVGFLLATALVATPAIAGTPKELEQAKARLVKVQADLDRAASELQVTYDRYQGTQAEMEETRAAIRRVKGRIDRLRTTLAARARSVYVSGPAGTLDVVFSSASFSDLSDRMQYMGAVQESDEDLVIRAEVNREVLRREQARLAEIAEEQRAAIEEMEAHERVVQANLDEIADLVDQLTEKLQKERAAERRRRELIGQPPDVADLGPPGAGFQTCPVSGPNSFVDSWGAPRSGGRVHTGTDIIAAHGTPVVAAQSGSVRFDSDPLGGLTAYVYGDNGDTTYYAHLSSYGPAEGGVSAGSVIGYVGSTGNAGDVNHLHFSYYPGGGAPVNPYPYLLQVC